MKKTFAVVLALIMALSMIPAMALASSAETIEVETGVYGNGAETWCGGDASLQPYGAATQFLLRVGGENYATFLAGFDSYSWKFTFTDMEGNKFETTNAPNSKYDGGTWGILRVIANTDKAYIQIGNSTPASSPQRAATPPITARFPVCPGKPLTMRLTPAPTAQTVSLSFTASLSATRSSAPRARLCSRPAPIPTRNPL